MKKQTLLIISLLLIFGGCKKAEKFTQFYLPFDDTVVVPATLGINLPFTIHTPDITIGSESYFELNNTEKALVEKAKLERLTLTLSQPANGDFSFLEEIRVYIRTDNLPKKKIAWKEPIPDETSNELELDISEDTLESYIRADTFILVVETVTDELLSEEHRIDIHCVFWVDARVLGL